MFFSLKDHFDGNMGDLQFEDAPLRLSRGFVDEEDKEEDEFFDAASQYQNDFASGKRSLSYSELSEEREELPVTKPNSKISIWKILKDSIGKDLSKLAVPVYFNEPISMLQKVSEVMEYDNLIN